MNQPAANVPLRLPDSMAKADIGPYVASLREHYGLSQQDVASRLHIRIKYVQAIEESKFDALPGKVYAKGYVHTYAEFLGLDAVQVVDKCFGPELAREKQEHFIPAPARISTPPVSGKWLKWAAVAVLLAGAYSLFLGEETPAPVEEEEKIVVGEQVQEVPEDILSALRVGIMPTAANRDCLSGDGALSCFYASRQLGQWVNPPAPPSYALLVPGNAPAPKPVKAKAKKP